MNRYRIAVIPGDGIGKEVIQEGVKVLQTTAQLNRGFEFNFENFPWGSSYYLAHGQMMPSDGLNILRDFDAIYFGAVGSADVPDHISLRGLRLAICQGFEQYANLRPSRLLPGVESPLRLKGPKTIDFVVIRENTEGEYSGAGGRIHRGLASETAVETTIFTRSGVERIIRFAYEVAKSKPRRLLSSVSKSNAQEHVFTLWDEIFVQIGQDYPDVQTERVLVDAMAARFVLHPESLDVVVASNLFADILTDLGGAICGSLGVAPSGNLNPERDYPSMFEPIHGSALDIFGRGIANPIGMVWSGAMMLEFLGEVPASEMILQAIIQTTSEGKFMTPDLGGKASTEEVGDAIVENLMKLA
ncbi:MAG: tartrate dehydrogenase [Anaerolineales bacterium]|jgi:tartrate dehydrogenase/decarboxylase/D-malate dehydrogenase